MFRNTQLVKHAVFPKQNSLWDHSKDISSMYLIRKDSQDIVLHEKNQVAGKKMRVLQIFHRIVVLEIRLAMVQKILNPCINFCNMHFHELFEDSSYEYISKILIPKETYFSSSFPRTF